MFVPAGTIVTVVVSGEDYIVVPSFSALANSNLQTRIAQAMDSSLPILSDEVATASAFSTAALSGLLTDRYSYTATMVLKPTVDYTDVADIIGLVKAACSSATGLNPVSASATIVGGTTTGDPAQGAPQADINPGAAFSSAVSGLTSIVGAIPKASEIVLVLLIIGIGVLIMNPKLRPAGFR